MVKEIKEVENDTLQQTLPSAIATWNLVMARITQAQARFSVLDRVPIGVCVLQSDRVVFFL